MLDKLWQAFTTLFKFKVDSRQFRPSSFEHVKTPSVPQVDETAIHLIQQIIEPPQIVDGPGTTTDFNFCGLLTTPSLEQIEGIVNAIVERVETIPIAVVKEVLKEATGFSIEVIPNE